MSIKVPQTNDDHEIDLVRISQKINTFFKSINRGIFNVIQFFVRNWIVVLLLIVVGFSIGNLLDKMEKKFDNQIIVKPNFESVDYLYSKIDLLESKIEQHDTNFFRKIGISNTPKITSITIEPIIDLFKFVDNNEQNLEVLKLITASGDLKSIVSEKTTLKNYPFYIITFSTDGSIKGDNYAIQLLEYINSSAFYTKIKNTNLINLQRRIKDNEQIVKQIDAIINNFSNSKSVNNHNDLVYYNENTQLNDLIKTKDGLLRENGNLKTDLISLDKIIKESGIVTNLERKEKFEGKMKFILPFIFLTLFIFVVLFRRFYNNQKIQLN